MRPAQNTRVPAGSINCWAMNSSGKRTCSAPILDAFSYAITLDVTNSDQDITSKPPQIDCILHTAAAPPERERGRACKLDLRSQFDWRPARFGATDFSQIIDDVHTYCCAGGGQFSAPRFGIFANASADPILERAAVSISIERAGYFWRFVWMRGKSTPVIAGE